MRWHRSHSICGPRSRDTRSCNAIFCSFDRRSERQSNLSSLSLTKSALRSKMPPSRETPPREFPLTRFVRDASLGMPRGKPVRLAANEGRENDLERKSSGCFQIRSPRIEEGDLRIQLRLPSPHCSRKFGERFSALSPL